MLGGGQLGRMLIQESLKYDDEWFTLDPAEDCSCSTISKLTVGSFADHDTVLNFGRGKDVVTIEIEHVNVEALKKLEGERIKVIPSASVVEMIQQKCLQKDFYRRHQIPTPHYQNITRKEELDFPLPFVQKMNTGGYDGKGVQIIRTEEDLAKIWDVPSVIEALVDIDKELSIIVAKNESGEECYFPVTEMVADPVLNLLDFNICPAEISEDVLTQIKKIAHQFLSAVDSPGLFAIELLLDKQGTVWVNETAPRLHNSGHQTQEGNFNSQFEQFYRVLCNLPLADVEALGYSGMLNIVGDNSGEGPVTYRGLADLLAMPATYVHIYGKKVTKPGRKMGHVNILAEDRAHLLERLSEAKKIISATVKTN